MYRPSHPLKEFLEKEKQYQRQLSQQKKQSLEQSFSCLASQQQPKKRNSK